MDEIQASCIYWLHFKVTFAFRIEVFAKVKFFQISIPHYALSFIIFYDQALFPSLMNDCIKIINI